MALQGRLSTLALVVAALAACGRSVTVPGSGGGTTTAGSGTSSSSAQSGTGSGQPLPTYPLVVQPLDTGKMSLVISSKPVDCSLSDPLPVSLFGCDRFVITARFPASAFVKGGTLTDGVGGVTLGEDDGGPSDSSGQCPSVGGGILSASTAIQLVDITDTTVTAQLSNAQTIFYTGPVNGTYTGALCGTPADPLPTHAVGDARVIGTDPVEIVVSSDAASCMPNPPLPTACPSWQLDMKMPASMLTPGPVDLNSPNVNVFFVGNGNLHQPPQSSMDCPSLAGGLLGDITINAVDASQVVLTLDHCDDGIDSIGVDGVYTATRCP
jgi:hypothetical protein